MGHLNPGLYEEGGGAKSLGNLQLLISISFRDRVAAHSERFPPISWPNAIGTPPGFNMWQDAGRIDLGLWHVGVGGCKVP